MAAKFQIVTQYPGVQTLGGTQTQDVVFVGINTQPSGIYVEFPVLQSAYNKNVVNAAALGWATIAETLAAEEWVSDVQWTQIVTPSNLLKTAWILTVVSSSGNSAGQITVANDALGPKLDADAIKKLHAELDATENL